MPGKYLQYIFTIEPKEPATEILIAQLAEAGFDSFEETENGLIAYVTVKNDEKINLADIGILRDADYDIKTEKENVPDINWNSEWEKNFKPIQIDNSVSIRAPFHPNPGLKYDIVIEPKMSFGTGHHETTHLMVQHLLQLELNKKRVLDMGCGTGILAILSEMRGAKPIDAIDIDSWCYGNSVENAKRNNCDHINVYHGDAALLDNKTYDVIIANINRNILLNDLNKYSNCLDKNGILLLSGFYVEDIPIIEAEATRYNLKLIEIKEKNNWVAVRLNA